MESTGKYWIPVYNILEDTCTIVLSHPKYVKAIRGKKTDRKDHQNDIAHSRHRTGGCCYHMSPFHFPTPFMQNPGPRLRVIKILRSQLATN